jgi:hypothetical protein
MRYHDRTFEQYMARAACTERGIDLGDDAMSVDVITQKSFYFISAHGRDMDADIEETD